MGAGTAKFKSLTALGEGHVAMLLDRGSIPLASTIHAPNITVGDSNNDVCGKARNIPKTETPVE